MTARGDIDLHRSVAELVGLLPEQETFEETLDRVVRLARETVAGCDSASVTILSTGEEPARTVAQTDDLALRVDEHQYEHDAGPCLDASRTGLVFDVPSMLTEERWGPFPGEAIRHGAQASLSLPLSVRGSSIGALNLYARTERAFTRSAHDVASLFAAQAAVAVANAQVYSASRRLAEQLEDAMRSRSTIEQAKGILMAERGCDADTAFDLLRAASQRQNVKLRDIAQRLVDSKTNAPAR